MTSAVTSQRHNHQPLADSPGAEYELETMNVDDSCFNCDGRQYVVPERCPSARVASEAQTTIGQLYT